MYDNTWDNRAQEVHLSEKHGLVFIVDYYDKIWIYKLNGQQFISENNYDFAYVNDCSNGVWLSSTIDESHDDYVRIFSLVKHNATSVQSGEGMGYEDYLGNSTSIVWRNIDPSITEITNENNEIYVLPLGENNKSDPMWGTTRAHVANAFYGVCNSFSKTLELNGTGLRLDPDHTPQWLQDGDVVEMEIRGLGKLSNTMRLVDHDYSILAKKKNMETAS